MSILDQRSLIKRILTLLPIGVWIMDRDGTIVYGNPAGQKIWEGARYVGPARFGEYKGWWVSTGKRFEADEWAAARAIRDGETSIDEEVRIECFDGSQKVMLNSAMPIVREDGVIEGAIIVNHDITARKRFEEGLRERADRDPLTGVLNRRRLFEQLESEMQRAKRYGVLSVVMFDIDHFKRINDDHGHSCGDRVLASVAAIVRGTLRGIDCLARYGGEEFVRCGRPRRWPSASARSPRRRPSTGCRRSPAASASPSTRTATTSTAC
jgi:hypothetical protein